KRRTEDSLRARESELQQITDNLPAGVAYYDRNFFCCFANPGYAALFDLSVAKTVGRHLEAIIGKENMVDETEYFRRALGGEAISYQRARSQSADNVSFIEIALVPARSP